MKHLRKIMVAVLTIMLAAVVAGCGAKEVAMKEFKSSDDTMSMMLNEEWNEQDMGEDNWIAATNKMETEAVIVMQIVKMTANVTDMEEVKDVMEVSYQLTDIEEATKPEISEMSSIEAYTGKMEGAQDVYVVYGETDYAYYAIVYGANNMTSSKEEYFLKCCESFEENAPEVVNNSTVELTDTIRWMNATYAILTHVNGWDYTIYAGLPANEETKVLEQEALEEWWGVTDRASADENMEWLLSEGHRTTFVEDMESFEEIGMSEVAQEDRADFILEYYELTEEEAERYADLYGKYEIYGENTIAAWDYSRAMSVLSFYYLAGYYTETEALDLSFEVSKEIQNTFNSWDEYMESYMIGYEYWSEESSEERQAIYEELKAAEDNPYAIDWNLSLEKTW